MATVIDALVVTLGLNAAGFVQGQKQTDEALKKTKEAAQRSTTDIQTSAANAAGAFVKLRNEVLALFALFTAGRGMKQMATEITGSDAALGRMATNVGMTTQQLGAWEEAAKRAGGSAAGIDGSVSGLAQSFQQLALTGQSDVVPYFRMLGVQFADTNGKMLPLGETLLNLADKLHAIAETDPAKALAIGAGLHLDTGTTQLLMQGRAAVQQSLDAAASRGVASPEDAKRAQELTNSFLDFQQVVTQIARTLLNDVSPAITEFFRSLAEWLKTIDWREVGNDIKAALAGVAGFLKGLSWSEIKLGVGGFIAILAGSAMTKAIGNVGLMAAAVTALRSAFGIGASGAAGGGGVLGWVGGLLGMSGGALAALVASLFALHGDTDPHATPDGFLPGWKPDNGPAPKPYTGPTETVGSMVRRWFGIPDRTPSPHLMPQTGAADGAQFGTPQQHSATEPRGIRNNNPGNLDFKNQPGATPEVGGANGHTEAVFPTMEMGIAAMANQLKLYVGRGLDTISKIVSTYAPPSENDTAAYIAQVSRATGIGPNDKLDINNPKTLGGIIDAMITQEEGRNRVTPAQIASGVAASLGLPGPAPSSAAFLIARERANRTPNVSSTATTHVTGPINITTPTADPAGHATAFRRRLLDDGLVAQANAGLA